MAVLPENMNRLNTEDVPGSLSVIDEYIRYMRERIEFAMTNMTKSVRAAGTVSSVEIVLMLEEQKNEIAALKSRISNLEGNTTSLNNEEV